MSGIFQECKSLISIPDISKWDTKNVNDMSYLFSKCISLKSFPDISVWVLKKKVSKELMFEGINKNIILKKFKGCVIY